MSSINDEAANLLGGSGGQPRRFLTPVDMESGLTIRDRYRYLKNTMMEDSAMQSMMTNTATDSLKQMSANKAMAALSEEDDYLTQLQKLDPSSENFENQAIGLHAAAAHNPAVARALEFKMDERKTYNNAMMGLAQSAAEAGLSPEQYDAQAGSARKFIQRGDMDSYGKILFQNSQLAQSREEAARLRNMEKSYELQTKANEASMERSMEKERASFELKKQQYLEQEFVKHKDTIASLKVPPDMKEIFPEFMEGEAAGHPQLVPQALEEFGRNRIMDQAFNSDLFGEDFNDFKFLDRIVGEAEVGTEEEFIAFLADNPEAMDKMKDFGKALQNDDLKAFLSSYGPKNDDRIKNPRTGVLEGDAPTLEKNAALTIWLEGIWNQAQEVKKFSAEMNRYRTNVGNVGTKAKASKPAVIPSVKGKDAAAKNRVIADLYYPVIGD